MRALRRKNRNRVNSRSAPQSYEWIQFITSHRRGWRRRLKVIA